MWKKIITDKYRIATYVAILFHVVGLAGILWIDAAVFASLTSLNMLVMLALICWTQEQKNAVFYFFALICYAVGFLTEAAGVRSGLLFGNYSYGDALGFKMKNVPLLIGVNWFIVIYCCGTAMNLLQQKIRSRLALEAFASFTWWSRVSIVIDGALLAVLFDWIMEPAALALGFWQWEDGIIPVLNYITWFAVSVLLLVVFSLLGFNKANAFAVHLLLIQFMFFLVLRTFLPA
ncbi:MAG: carotenoid biosynthesis protein [Chitinophagaceae bacterium]|nr:carotenoid biosynthesis protein [Chitinophagaceae bacterium]